MKTNEKVRVNGKDYPLPEEYKLLDSEGFAYEVPLSSIRYAEPPTDDKSGEYRWYNYRHVTKNGLGDEEMKALRNSIRDLGLLNKPLCCWAVDDNGIPFPKLLAGERRVRSLRTLVEENKKVFSIAKNVYVPAQDVYSHLIVTIRSIADDDEALSLAWGSEDREDWGDSAKTRMVMELRKAGKDDKDILRITRKSTSWLRDEDLLAGLDEDTYTAYDRGTINRTVALKLCRIDDLEERKQLLEEIHKEALADRQRQINELKSAVNKAETAALIAEGKDVITESDGDTEHRSKSRKKVESLKARAAKKKIKLEKIKEKPVQAKSTHINRVAKKRMDANGVAGAKPVVDVKVLTPAKIIKQLGVIERSIKSGGKDENGKQVMDETALQFLQAFVKPVVKGICEGKDDIIAVFKTAYANYQKKISARDKSFAEREKVVAS
jgi:hypothetical protein